jgi:hypothetical protein
LQLGEPDEALSQLESAVALGYQRALLKVDAALAPLSTAPRFEALVSPAPERPKVDR